MAQDNMALLGLAPKASVVEIYNAANDTKLKNDDATLRLLAAEDDNVEGMLGVRPPTSPGEIMAYKNTVNVRWKRLDLAMFFGFNLEIPLDLPTDTVLLLDELFRRTGLRIDISDVELEIIDYDQARHYKLKALPTSLRWYGEVEINLLKLIKLEKILPPPINLGDLGVELDPEHWVLEYGGNLNGNLHTALWNALVAPVTLDGDVAKAPLVSAFQDVLIQRNSLGRWVDSDSVQANNLRGATVIYNGPGPDHLPAHYNQTLTHCVRLLLSSFYCPTPNGIVTVFYDPGFSPGKEQ